MVLGVVDYMLESDKDKIKEGSLNLTSLFKKRGRRKKKRADVEAFSDEDDYLAPNCMVRTSVEGSRKSKRITMRLEAEEAAISATVETEKNTGQGINELRLVELIDQLLNPKMEVGVPL